MDRARTRHAVCASGGSTVKPGKGDTTVIHWTGTFKRKNSADNPPDNQTDNAARKVVTGIYSSGLANLKKQLEH
jgi:hypothetical protein